VSARSQLAAVLKRGRVLVGFALVAAAIARQKPEFLEPVFTRPCWSTGAGGNDRADPTAEPMRETP
jgi:hypothetical protein